MKCIIFTDLTACRQAKTEYLLIFTTKTEIENFLDRVFIRHRRSENSPATMQNSLAKFRWSVVVFLYRHGAVM